jgi:hypothetical protein
MVEESTRDTGGASIPIPPTSAQISAFMAEMGRKGGKIGGKRRLISLTPERRKEIALKAARARWANNGKH